jgi:hypothetical protein
MNAQTGAEKVIWKSTKAFYLQLGHGEAEAESEANRKIESMRALSRRRDIIRK